MSLRKIVFWVHLVAGCLAGTVILLMSLTGCLLAYRQGLTNWANRGYRSVRPAATASHLPIETLLADAAAQNQALPSAITLRSGPEAPAEIGFGHGRIVLADVYTGKVLAESRAHSFFDKVEGLHRWLGAGDGPFRPLAHAVKGAATMILLGLTISGLYLWLPRQWTTRHVRAVAWFRSGLVGRARDFNWHNVVGLWCAAPLLVIVLTGIPMAFPWATDLVYRITGNGPPPRESGDRRARGERNHNSSDSPFVGLNPLWDRAEQQQPNWRSISLRLPPARNGNVTFSIDTGAGNRPDQRSQLTLNARSGTVVRWEVFSSYNSGRRLRAWIRFVHTGEAGGMFGRTIAAMAALGAATLVVTGFSLTIRRLSNAITRSRNRRVSVQTG